MSGFVPYQEDPVQHIKRITLQAGRAAVFMISHPDQDPQLIAVTGVSFDYNFAVAEGVLFSFGIIPPGGAAISISTIAMPDIEDGRETDSVQLDLLLFPDPTPGVLEALLASSGGNIPPSVVGYPQSLSLVATVDNQFPELAFSGVVWTLSAEGLTGQIIFGETRSQDVFVTYDPPVPPIPG